MNYIDYLQFRLDDATATLKKANAQYLNAVSRTHDRCIAGQKQLDDAGNGGLIDVIQESFSWVENEVQHVRWATERFVAAKQAVETAHELSYQMSIAKLSSDTMIDLGRQA